MRAHLVAHGNSQALVIPAAVRKLVGMPDGAEVDIATNGTSLLITPITLEQRQKRVAQAIDSVFRDPTHRGAMLLLADQ